VHAIHDARKQGVSTGHNYVAEEIPTDAVIALHDGFESAVVDAGGLLPDQGRLEQSFGATEAFDSDGNDGPIRELVAFNELVVVVESRFYCVVEVESYECQRLFDVTDEENVVATPGEGITTLDEKLIQVVSDVATTKVQRHNRMW
jgi:hypothetical protein